MLGPDGDFGYPKVKSGRSANSLVAIMQIIPVIDLKSAQVVHAVAGDRDSYVPIQSGLCDSADPASVSSAFGELGLTSRYVADLDAIGGQSPDADSLRRVATPSHLTICDVGLKSVDELSRMQQLTNELPIEWVVALETLDSPEMLEDYARQANGRVTFSLDLKSGVPIAHSERLRLSPPLEIARIAGEYGIRRLIVLDLADVGTNRGNSTIPLIEKIRESVPAIEVIGGGGVKGMDDLRLLNQAGCAAVLVATAIHRGVIARREIQEVAAWGTV